VIRSVRMSDGASDAWRRRSDESAFLPWELQGRFDGGSSLGATLCRKEPDRVFRLANLDQGLIVNRNGLAVHIRLTYATTKAEWPAPAKPVTLRPSSPVCNAGRSRRTPPKTPIAGDRTSIAAQRVNRQHQLYPWSDSGPHFRRILTWPGEDRLGFWQ
jgi:hypothetical protein